MTFPCKQELLWSMQKGSEHGRHEEGTSAGLSPGPIQTLLHHCSQDKTSCIVCTARGAAEHSRS